MLKSQKSEIGAVNLKTGELVSGAMIITPAMREEINKRKERQKAISEEHKKYGHFCWFFYNLKEKLFNGKIDGATVTRLMYLATFLSYKDNKLYFDNKRLIYKDKLQMLLKLTDTTYKAFMSDCKKDNLIIINDDNTISLSDLYFKRGKLSKRDLNSDSFITRIYNDGIRYLYKNADICFHKNLAYLFMVIPYVNIDYNILCSNPLETNIDKINCVDTKGLCSLLGYNLNNFRRLKENLKKIVIKNSPVISFVDNAFGEKIFMNPKLFYAGDRHDDVWILGKF